MMRTRHRAGSGRTALGTPRAAVLLVAVSLVTAACASTTQDADADLDVALESELPTPSGTTDPGTRDSLDRFANMAVGPGGDATSGTTAGGEQTGPGDPSDTTAGTGGSSTSGTTGTDSSATGTTTGTATSGTSSTGGGTGTTGSLDSDVGITAETIKIGFIVRRGDPGAAFGLAFGATPDQAMVEGMVEEINATGGIAGRQVEVVFAENDDTDQSDETQSRIQNDVCTQLTEDEQVAIVLSRNAAGSYRAYDCYAQHGTPIFDFNGIRMDQQRFDELKPWVMPPFWMNPTVAARLLPKVLAEQGFMTQKMGVVIADIPVQRRTGEDILIPEIERHGGKVIDTAVLAGNEGDQAAGIASAVLRFKGQQIDRVVFWSPGGGTWLLFSRQAEAQSYRPGYGIASHDVPNTVADVIPPEQHAGTVGLGWTPQFDVRDQVYAPTAREKECWDVINRRAGTNWSSRSAGSGIAMNICDYFWSLQAALRSAEGRPLLRRDVQAHLVALGTSYQPVATNSALLSPGKADGVGSYTAMAYDAGCSCFKYVSNWRPVS